MIDLSLMKESTDMAIRTLEQEMRGASWLASPDDCIEMLNTIGEVASEKEFEKFCNGLKDCAEFKPLAFYGRPKEASGACIMAHLTYEHLGVEMSVKVIPHHMYGAKMTMHWSALPSKEETPDTRTWQWQDLNNVSRTIIGYAVMTSEERDCFSRWEFFS